MENKSNNSKTSVLSLFDGMACGMIAFQKLGIQIDNYYAYEVDKYAIQTVKHNFPNIQELGDVFNADFKQYEGIDYLIGGSPCVFWSIAQSPNKRETTASGMGWELFSQYVRALNEAKPKYFLYENNKSMAKAIYKSISETFGFEPICVNSALVSAQNRQRLYWVGKRNEDGTYSKVDIEQQEDKGILLKDILTGYDLTNRNKSFAYTSRCQAAIPQDTIIKHRHTMVAEPVGTTKDGKSYCLTQGYSNGSGENIGNYVTHTLEKGCKSMVAEPVACRCRGRKDKNGNGYAKYECRNDGKANTLDTNSVNGSMVAQPVCMRYERSNTAKKLRKDYESGKIKHGYHEYSELHPRTDGKSNTLSTVLKDNPICEPVRCFTLPREDGIQTQSKQYRVYDVCGKSTTLCAEGGGMGAKTGLYAIPIAKELTDNEIGYMFRKEGRCDYGYIQKLDDNHTKAKCLTANISKGVPYNCLFQKFAEPIDFDGDIPIKAISYADGKTYKVYAVKDGQITIKEKQYPIKLQDGYYIIRKLTVSECKRLQTVPEWYEFPVSDTQSLKMLGNGWTVDVISHLLSATL